MRTTEFYIIVDTDQYAGNFQEMLTAFATGVKDFDANGFVDDFEQAFLNDETTTDDQFEELIDVISVDSFEKPCMIIEGPNHDKDVGMSSVAIPLQRRPTRAEWDFIVARIQAFPKAWEELYEFAVGDPMTIIDVRLVYVPVRQLTLFSVSGNDRAEKKERLLKDWRNYLSLFGYDKEYIRMMLESMAEDFDKKHIICFHTEVEHGNQTD